MSIKKGRALFPGSFDPLTRGHVDLVKRALTFVDEIIVAVLDNPAKETLFSVEERVKMIEREFASLAPRVAVGSFSGLLVQFARQVDAQLIIRGLRAISDYDYEAQMALVNKNLWEDLETLFLMAREENSYVSSSLVRQIAAFGGDVGKLVTPVVEEALRLKLNRR